MQGDSDTFNGFYCPSFFEGKKIDCPISDTEICINVVRINVNIFEGTFESPSFNGSRNIRLTFNEVEKNIKIEIISSKGEFYLPHDIIFKR